MSTRNTGGSVDLDGQQTLQELPATSVIDEPRAVAPTKPHMRVDVLGAHRQPGRANVAVRVDGIFAAYPEKGIVLQADCPVARAKTEDADETQPAAKVDDELEAQFAVHLAKWLLAIGKALQAFASWIETDPPFGAKDEFNEPIKSPVATSLTQSFTYMHVNGNVSQAGLAGSYWSMPEHCRIELDLREITLGRDVRPAAFSAVSVEIEKICKEYSREMLRILGFSVQVAPTNKEVQANSS